MATDSEVASACMSTSTIGVSFRSSGTISSALRNGQSIGCMNTRPMRLSTATRCGPAFTVTCPTPGVPTGKFAGRRRRFSLVMYSTISFLSQMWLPEVSTSAPCSSTCLAMAGVTPKPPAEFSTLTTQTSIACSWRSFGRSLPTAVRPESPKTSPTIRTFMGQGLLLRDFDRARRADDVDLDVPRVLHLCLDALGGVLGELVGDQVAYDLGLGDDALLAPRLDRVAHLHSLVVQRDLLELGQPLD